MAETGIKEFLDAICGNEKLQISYSGPFVGVHKLGISNVIEAHILVTDARRKTLIYDGHGLGFDRSMAKDNCAVGVLHYLKGCASVPLAVKENIENFMLNYLNRNPWRCSGGFNDLQAIAGLMHSSKIASVQADGSRAFVVTDACVVQGQGDDFRLTDQTLLAISTDVEGKFLIQDKYIYRGRDVIVLASPNFINNPAIASTEEVFLRQLPWTLTAQKVEINGSVLVRLTFACMDPFSNTWTDCHAHVNFELLAQKTKMPNFVVEKKCKFITQSDNRAISEFLLTGEIINSPCLYTLHDDMIFLAKVWLEIPSGMRWLNTDFCGLSNTKGTCHLNSNLQLFYFLNVIRDSVLHLNLNFGDVSPFLIELRSLFYKMQSSKKDVLDTKNLLLSCKEMNFEEGNSSTSTFTFILATLQSGPKLVVTYATLFQSKIARRVKIGDLWQMKIEEPSYFKLTVDKYYKCVEDVFEVYFGGKTNEEKIGFMEAPAILALHLRRYDDETHQSINKLLRFRPTLNLTSFMIGPSNRTSYSLFAVRVQIKKNEYHAMIYINPNLDGTVRLTSLFIEVCERISIWYAFNDEQVSKADLTEVVESNRGNNDCSDENFYKFATFLVYIADNEKSKLSCRTQHDHALRK